MAINYTIYFDMDGTIADLYGVENWLEYLINKNAFPYENAKPLLKLSLLARILNELQRNGYRLGIISWLAKNSNEEYDKAVTDAMSDERSGLISLSPQKRQPPFSGSYQ